MRYVSKLSALAVFIGLATLAISQPAPKAASSTASNSTNPQPVNVTNSSIPVTQSGAWNVGIAGTPTVNVASLPPVNLNSASVQVANPSNNPIPTLNVDEPTTYPYAFQLCGGALSKCGYTQPTVPTSVNGAAVKRLVVEFVSGYCEIAPNTPAPAYAYLYTNSSSGLLVFFGLTSTPSPNIFTFGGLTKMYLNPGDNLVFTVEAAVGTTDSDWTCSASFQGYLATQ